MNKISIATGSMVQEHDGRVVREEPMEESERGEDNDITADVTKQDLEHLSEAGYDQCVTISVAKHVRV